MKESGDACRAEACEAGEGGTPYEMEEQLKNLHARTSAFEQILPTLATKDDLHLTTAALQHEIETGFQEAKNHADRLNEIPCAQIRLLAEATKEDLRVLRQEMATKGDLQELRREMRLIGGHVRARYTSPMPPLPIGD